MMKSFAIWTLIAFISSPLKADIFVEVVEKYSETVKASGALIQGLQVSSEYENSYLFLDFPEDSSGQLCIDLSSFDGKYKANIKHDIVEPISGITKVSFESKYHRELQTFGADELAIKASFSEKCGTQKGKYLVAGWQQLEDLKNSSVKLLLRSEARIDQVHLPNEQNPQETLRCEKIEGINMVSFDTECEFSLAQINKTKGFDITRKRLRPFPTVRVVLAR